jgi:hypothetical protein
LIAAIPVSRSLAGANSSIFAILFYLFLSAFICGQVLLFQRWPTLSRNIHPGFVDDLWHYSQWNLASKAFAPLAWLVPAIYQLPNSSG